MTGLSQVLGRQRQPSVPRQHPNVTSPNACGNAGLLSGRGDPRDYFHSPWSTNPAQ